MSEKNPIQVADKIFYIIETMASTGPIGLSELSREVNLNKTTTHRILNSLIYMGYVRQDTATSHYSLSFKIWDIANQLLNRIDIVEEARPHLKNLAASTGETVHLVQIEGIQAIYIAKVESENSVRLVSKVGKSIPLYCSGVGKAILADLPDEKIKEIWNASHIEALTQYTITDFAQFMKEIEKIRKCGYATDEEENELGVRCIAVSLPAIDGSPKYAFSISAPIHRMDKDRMQEVASFALETKAKLAP